MSHFKIFSVLRAAFFASAIFLTSLAAMAAVGQRFQADNWQHIQLGATNGVKISVDYLMLPQCINYQKDGRNYQVRMASPVWFNVYGVNGNAAVEVTMESYRQDMIAHGGGANPVIRTYEHFDRKAQLRKNEQNRFTGNIGAVSTRVTSSSARVEDRILQKIQITINGVPLIDPVNGTSFFGISMYDRVPCM